MRLFLRKLYHKILYVFRDRKYDVYCPYCSSCGVTGCCSPTICINHPKGFYCQTNMGELRVSYYTLDKFWSWMYEDKVKNKETLDKLDEIYDKEEDELHEYFKSLPEKLTLKEKIKKWIK
jgi:hypothetical protein